MLAQQLLQSVQMPPKEVCDTEQADPAADLESTINDLLKAEPDLATDLKTFLSNNQMELPGRWDPGFVGMISA